MTSTHAPSSTVQNLLLQVVEVQDPLVHERYRPVTLPPVHLLLRRRRRCPPPPPPLPPLPPLSPRPPRPRPTPAVPRHTAHEQLQLQDFSKKISEIVKRIRPCFDL